LEANIAHLPPFHKPDDVLILFRGFGPGCFLITNHPTPFEGMIDKRIEWAQHSISEEEREIQVLTLPLPYDIFRRDIPQFNALMLHFNEKVQKKRHDPQYNGRVMHFNEKVENKNAQ
jgi:hypothetical protein